MKNYIFTSKKSLSPMDIKFISQLSNESSLHDNYSYELYLEEDNLINLPQYFLCHYNKTLVGCLTLCIDSDDTLTIYSLVSPSHRNNGIFTNMLNKLTHLIINSQTPYKTLEFHIPQNKDNQDYFQSAHNILENNNFSLSHNEYLLSFNLCDSSLEHFKHNLKSIALPVLNFDNDNDEILLFLNENYIGGCFIYTPLVYPKSYATIFSYEIVESFRGKGYGKSGLYSILSYLKSKNYKKVILHVTEKNKKAHNLYTSCGFLIDSSLSIYQKCII